MLAARFPGVPNLGDLTAVLDWRQVEPVDVVCAGYPCQPYSHAGKRQGDDDDRAIFSYIATAISVLRPRILCLENVSGHLTLGGPGVIGTLTSMGYDDIRWGVVRASDAGAPHKRARWFCVARIADASDFGHERAGGSRRRGVGSTNGSGAAADASGAERRTPQHETVDTAARSAAEPGERDSAPAADAGSERHGPRQDARGVGLLDRRDEGTSRQRQRTRGELGDRDTSATTDADLSRREGVRPEHRLGEASDRSRPAHRFGPYESAIQRWEYILGRAAPAPVDDRGLNPWFVEWMLGLPEGWVCDLGLSRTAMLKMLGNGCCQQQAELALGLLSDA